MLNTREKFYKDNVLKFISDKDASILICGAGPTDKSIFELCGFRNVTISNINPGMISYPWAPYQWACEDAESLSYADNSFDYVVIHEAIHHASLPHLVITEMYRVARKGVLAIEAKDSFVMRLLIRLDITQDYEYAGVYHNNCQGGVNNTEIPNFIYRWTEREIEKTIKSYAPFSKHTFAYSYGTGFPFVLKFDRKAWLKYILIKTAQPFFFLFTKMFRGQQNLFAFYISKPGIPEDLYPWVRFDEETNQLRFNKEWGLKKYGR